jgi:hypothetical protein
MCISVQQVSFSLRDLSTVYTTSSSFGFPKDKYNQKKALDFRPSTAVSTFQKQSLNNYSFFGESVFSFNT